LTFFVQVAGRQRTIDVRRNADGWHVTVDGRAVDVDVASSADRLSLLIGGRSYDVAIDRRGAADLVVHVDGSAVPVSLGRRPVNAVVTSASGPAPVVAPMPGRIVKLLVTAGDQVAARQGVVVVEAMKMENELRAPKAGTVREVRVSEGSSVEAGTTLLVVE
jgi:biotin carboxyl carrier protein